MARTSLNLNYGETYREHRYLNCAKSAERVNFTGAAEWYQNINANQYPTEATNGVAFRVYLPGAGTYAMKFRGSGSMSTVSFGTLTNSNRTYGGVTWDGGGSNGSVVTNGRVTFTVTTQLQSSVTIKGTSISDFVICRADEEDLLDAGGIFRPAFFQYIADFNPLVIRFMDSQSTNRNYISEFSQHSNADFLTYHSTNFIPAQKLGPATGTNDYTWAAYPGMPAEYTHGETIHFTVANANTSSTVTFDIGGRGPVTVWGEDETSALSTSGTNSQTRLITTVNYTAFYDRYFNKFFFHTLGTKVGHPIDMLVELCNQANVPGWFNIPVYASDDYMTDWCNYMVANYTPSTIYFEYGNEIWNIGGISFPLTARVAGWANTMQDFTGPQLSGSSGANFSAWYGLRFRQLVAIARPIFAAAGQSAKLKTIMAFQGASFDTATDVQFRVEERRLQNLNYPELSGLNAPYLFADIYAIGQYFTSNHVHWIDAHYRLQEFVSPGSMATLSRYARDYLSGDPARMDAALDWLHDDFLDSTSFYEYYANSETGRWANFNAIAVEWGNKQTVIYEFNQEVNGPTTGACTAGFIAFTCATTLKTYACSNAAAHSAIGAGNIAPTGIPAAQPPVDRNVYGSFRFAKDGTGITGATLLSGAAGTDSITSDFVAGDTITFNGTVVTFVASGATGNQLNVTDNINAFIAKYNELMTPIDPAVCLLFGEDASYGEQSGKINQFILAFLANYRLELVHQKWIQRFFSRSQSLTACLFGMATGEPWLTFPKISPLTETIGGDTTQTPNGNWRAHANFNNGRRLFKVS